MIGDRHMDIEGARHHGMPGIGVLWGFGGAAELQAAGADALASDPQALIRLLMGQGGTADRAAHGAA